MSSCFSKFEDTSYSSATQWLEDFLRNARQNGWYALYPSVETKEPGYHQIEFVWETDEFHVWYRGKDIVFPGHNIQQCAKYLFQTILSV
jgi:hypothetical protein